MAGGLGRVEPLVEHPAGKLIPQPPFGLSLSKPGAALRQAQRERVRGIEWGKGCSATVRWVAGAGSGPGEGAVARLWSAEKRRAAGLHACRRTGMLRDLTRRSCLNGALRRSAQ